MGPSPYGLPQGSVLDPLLYIIHTSVIGSLLTASAVLGHLYADYFHAYLRCLALNSIAAVRANSQTLGALEARIQTNRLSSTRQKTNISGWVLSSLRSWIYPQMLHWLPLQQRNSYRIIALVWWSLLGLTSAYLHDICIF